MSIVFARIVGGQRGTRSGGQLGCTRERLTELLFGDGVLQELAEGCAEGENFGEVVGGEMRAGGSVVGPFAADLDDADDAIAGKNGGADNSLNELGVFGGGLDAFKDAGVFHGGKIVDDFGAGFASGARGESGLAGEGNEADVFQGFRHDEKEMTPTVGDAQYGDLVRTDRQAFCDALGHGSEGYLGGGRGLTAADSVRETLEFQDETHFYCSQVHYDHAIGSGERSRLDYEHRVASKARSDRIKGGA